MNIRSMMQCLEPKPDAVDTSSPVSSNATSSLSSIGLNEGVATTLGKQDER